jgi:hypothetical protein
VSGTSARAPLAKVSPGPATLPSDAGQVWRDYDISPYTSRVTGTHRPEQALVDWILRETGYEAWHAEPLGFLSASPKVLRVYHTPAMHQVVQEMIDRFVNPQAESHQFGLRLATLDKPDWRVKAQRLLRPVAVQTAGTQAWLLAKEDAALLVADLRKRSDYREHSSPSMLVASGMSTVISVTRPRNYVRDVVLGGVWPGFESQTGQVDEGFSFEFSPLVSLDGRAADAVVKCHLDQVEKLHPLMLDVPTPVAPRQRTKIEVPQLASCRLHERFRWPTDQVLLVSLGIVVSPAPAAANNPLSGLALGGGAPRAELLVILESRGKTPSLPAATPPAAAAAVPPFRRR